MLAECRAETTMEYHLLVCLWEEALHGAADSGPRAFHLESWFQVTVPLEGPPRKRPKCTSTQPPVGRCQQTVEQGTLRITEFMVVGWDMVWKNKYHLLPWNAQSLCVCGLDRIHYFMGNNPGNYHGHLSGKWKGRMHAETNICDWGQMAPGWISRVEHVAKILERSSVRCCKVCGINFLRSLPYTTFKNYIVHST